MTDQLYPKGAAHILGAATKVDLVADAIKVLCYSGTFNGAHEFVSDLTGADIIARSGALAGKTITPGGSIGATFDANDLTLVALTGSAFSELLLFKDTGADASSPLVAIFDIATFTPDGSDVNVVWNASGILEI